MYYTEEESMVLLQKLQELLNSSHPSIEAAAVSDRCVFTRSDRSNMTEVYNFMCKVADVFGIDEAELGGANIPELEDLKKIGGNFYAERN